MRRNSEVKDLCQGEDAGPKVSERQGPHREAGSGARLRLLGYAEVFENPNAGAPGIDGMSIALSTRYYVEMGIPPLHT